MICKFCNTEISEEYKFCPKCGANLLKKDEKSLVYKSSDISNIKKNYNNSSILVVVASVLVIFVLFAFPLINLNGVKYTPEMSYTTIYSDKVHYISESYNNIFDSKISFFESSDHGGEKGKECTTIEIIMKITVLLMVGICLTCILMVILKKAKYIEIVFFSNIAVLLLFLLISNFIWTEKEFNPRGVGGGYVEGSYLAYSVGLDFGFVLTILILSVISIILFCFKYREKN